MHYFSKFACVVLSAGLLLTSCKGKDGDPGPAGAAGPTGPAGPSGQNLTGSVLGFVNPVSEDGVALAKAGVTVTITSVTPQLTQTTDANGRYEFTNLRNGTYNLTFSRSDLGLFKMFGYGHVGGDQPTVVGSAAGPTYLTAVSRTAISNLTVMSPRFDPQFGYYALFNGFVSNPVSLSPYRGVAIYGSTGPGTTSAIGTLIGRYFVYQGSGGGSSSTNIQVSRADFTAAGFASGSTVSAIVYGVPDYYNVSYIDTATGRTVFSGINPVGSQVVTFIVP